MIRLQSLVKDEKVQNRSLIKASTDEKFDMIVDINDSILDRVGNLLDEAEGLKKKSEDLVLATLNVPTHRKSKSNLTKWNEERSSEKEDQIKNQVIRKPQLDFEDKINNFDIFEPIIKFKHNSIKPLAIVKEYRQNGEFYYANPYEIEITSYKLLDRYLKQVANPKKPNSIFKTYFKYIDTENELNELLEYLKTVNEFAVDLEYHAQRSFLGFTCLMQVSTRDKNFIIDTIRLRSKMHILNEVFSDSNILKVFHGADLDVRWLQKDFGIYVVNMFDTGKAAKLLQFTSFSLSFLVKYYCNENLIKRYQLADWRIRPLPAGMLNYARSDTHSLLYIFDRIRNDIIRKDGLELLKQAFEHSRNVCLARFEIPTINDNSHMALIMKNRIDFNNRQKQAFKEIYAWRDNLARVEDECTNYVLPNHMMLKIAEVLPQEQQGILACCNPIPVMVNKHSNELHLIVLKARELLLKKCNDNVYLLKPIVNQIVDITTNMDILDEEHFDDQQMSAHDCLLDTPEMLHKIKLSRKTKEDEHSLSDFFAIKLATLDEKLINCLTPFDKYLKTIETKKKQIRLEEIEGEIKIDINQVPVIVSKDITNEPSKIGLLNNEIDKEEAMTRRLETTPLIEINKKKGKKNKQDFKVTCEVNASINNLITNAMSETSSSKANDETNNEEANKRSNQFDYDQADYSIFSQNNQPSQYFNPSEKFLNNKKQVRKFFKIFLKFKTYSS